MKDRVARRGARPSFFRFQFSLAVVGIEDKFRYGYDPLLFSIQFNDWPTSLRFRFVVHGRLDYEIYCSGQMLPFLFLGVVTGRGVALVPVRGTEREGVFHRLFGESAGSKHSRAGELDNVTSTWRKGAVTEGGEANARDLREVTLAVGLDCRA